MVIGLVGPWTCLMPPSTASDPPPQSGSGGRVGKEAPDPSQPTNFLAISLKNVEGDPLLSEEGATGWTASWFPSQRGRPTPASTHLLLGLSTPTSLLLLKKIIYTQSLKGFLSQEDTEDTETPEVSFNGGGGHENPPSVRANPCPVHHLRD